MITKRIPIFVMTCFAFVFTRNTSLVLPFRHFLLVGFYGLFSEHHQLAQFQKCVWKSMARNSWLPFQPCKNLQLLISAWKNIIPISRALHVNTRGRDIHPLTTRPNSCILLFHLDFPWQKRSMRNPTRNTSDRREIWSGNGWKFATERAISIPSTISTSSSYQPSWRKVQDISVCQINTITMPVGRKKVRHIDAEFTLKRVFGKSSFRWVVDHWYSIAILNER